MTSLSSSYGRSAKGRAKSLAASRVSSCADVLLKTVKVGVRKLRYKTVKALFEHIIQTLPTTGDGYCEPLIPNYFKILRIILEYPPHPEHLLKDDWHVVAHFCNEAVLDLNHALNESEVSFSHSARESSAFSDVFSRSVTPNGHGSSLRKASIHATPKSVKVSLKSSAEDILLCMKHLLATPNAPIGERAQVNLQTLIEYLQLSPHASHTQQAAFDGVSSIVAYIVTDDIKLTQDTIRSLIPLMCRFWQPKNDPLKDSMLIVLVHGEPHFKQIVQCDESGDFKIDLQELLEAFKDDYCKRPEREQLQVEDLELANAPYHRRDEFPLCLKAFRARSGVFKAEQPWTLLQISRSIVSALNSFNNIQDRPHVEEDFGPAMKRKKISSSWNNVLLLVKTSQGAAKLHAIQSIAFFLDHPVDNEYTLQCFLDVLLSCLSDNNSIIVSWAMLAMSR